MEQPKTGVWPGAPIVGRPDKPLGRGLEDISYLFLSRRNDEAPASDPMPDRRLERTDAEPEPVAQTVLLQRSASVTKEQVVATLRGREEVLEEGLRGIDASIPCDPFGEIDLLALDGAHHLTILDFDASPNDALLSRGICHIDWMVRNIPIVRRMYAGRAIDFSAQPRLFLLAPQFSPRLRGAARQIARPQITWIRYHVVHISGVPGILFERDIP